MNRARGFTIVELMVTIMIITMLVIAASSGVVRVRQSARDAQRVRDVLAIGTAMDQSATNARGLYPYDTANQTTNVFCAPLIGTPGSNSANGINFGLFLSRSIPTDPLPERTSATCANYRDGYTISNRYGSGNNLARPSSGQQYEYVIEVGLEGNRGVDEQTLVAGTDASSTVRKQYLLNGPACGTLKSCSFP